MQECCKVQATLKAFEKFYAIPIIQNIWKEIMEGI